MTENDNSNLKFTLKPIVFYEYPAFGPGVVKILQLVKETGSLSKSYRKMRLSSSKGWKILKRAEEDLGFPLVESSVGGKEGGYSLLTTEGQDMLHRYKKFTQELDLASKEIFDKYFRMEIKKKCKDQSLAFLLLMSSFWNYTYEFKYTFTCIFKLM